MTFIISYLGGALMLCYCKKCGRIVRCDNLDEQCDYCSSIVCPVPDEYLGGKSRGFIKQDLEQQFIDQYIKSSPEFDQCLFDHRDDDLFKRRMENKAKLDHGKSVIEEQSNIPKCPTCGSANIKRVSGTSKAVSVAMFGLLSQKVKKQFHCNNCGYEW